ncbi:MAG: glyceraldehyde-3-phosphate dehydrogenase [Deltaproteobacteria bacterium]|nr:MAG: glyceraldehyde-3-phosphate dehydrogenase [Deltaproteobacteria bacterium]
MDLAKGDLYFDKWARYEVISNKMLAPLNELRLERGVLIHVYGRSIAKVSSLDVLKAHRYGLLVTGEELTVEDTLPVLEQIANMDLGPCRIDLGKITHKFLHSGATSVADFLDKELASACTGKHPVLKTPQDLVLYGFGRIGRLVARVLLDKIGNGDKIRPKGIVVRNQGPDDLEKRAALLRLDSVHGTFKGTLEVDHDERALVANGNMMRLIDSIPPEELDYTRYGIDNAIVVDNTGRWRDREGLSRHLEGKGVKKVLLTAPGKGDIPNIVFGINNDQLDPSETIVSAASCTTNAIAPILKVMHERYGIVSGHIESCHSYTNDQNLIDNYHNKPRRGRAASLNMVITSTGAASAVAKVLPELKGKLTGNAIRVPTPNVSLAILKLSLAKKVSRDDINSYIRSISLNSPLQTQIDFTNSADIVSSDIVGSRHAGVFDGQATIVNEADPHNVVLYVWYDNEYGYTCQLMRLLQQMADIDLPEFPKA